MNDGSEQLHRRRVHVHTHSYCSQIASTLVALVTVVPRGSSTAGLGALTNPAFVRGQMELEREVELQRSRISDLEAKPDVDVEQVRG